VVGSKFTRFKIVASNLFFKNIKLILVWTIGEKAKVWRGVGLGERAGPYEQDIGV